MSSGSHLLIGLDGGSNGGVREGDKAEAFGLPGHLVFYELHALHQPEGAKVLHQRGLVRLHGWRARGECRGVRGGLKKGVQERQRGLRQRHLATLQEGGERRGRRRGGIKGELKEGVS
eukprot:1195542-Prorocentrum_minimum.AAC.8